MNGAGHYITQAPVLIITHQRIQTLDAAEEIIIHPIRNYDEDSKLIYVHMNLPTPDTAKTFLRFLRRINKYSQLKPNLLGFGLNINDIISDLIDHLERKNA